MFDKAIIALISPLGTTLLLGTLAWLLSLLRWRRTSLALLAVALLWLYVWSMIGPSQWLRGLVEQDYPPKSAAEMPAADAIVVLGGAISPMDSQDIYPDLGPAADRLWHTARLYHAGKAPLVVLSGGSDPTLTDSTEAASMKIFLRDLGVPDSAMLLEDQSQNTRQNAQFTANLLRQRGKNHVLLVTSALHMRRASALFEAAGLKVTPAATDHEGFGVPDWKTKLPNAVSLDGSGRAMKEVVGRWAGR